jgi:molybdopterin/thiamine biosynthesis adenylyltransferase
VSLSNLQRQIIHDTGSVGIRKVDSASSSIGRVNPHVRVEAHAVRLDAANAGELIGGYDIVLDGSDNFATRFLVADVAADLHKPLVTGAMSRFDASVTVLKPYENDNPGYRDLFPGPPPPGLVPTCAEAGILGALPGVIGSIQALEALKLVAGIGEPLVGRLLLYDALAQRFDEIRYARGKR